LEGLAAVALAKAGFWLSGFIFPRTASAIFSAHGFSNFSAHGFSNFSAHGFSRGNKESPAPKTFRRYWRLVNNNSKAQYQVVVSYE